MQTTLGQRLRSLREASKLTQGAAAAAISKTQGMISLWEADRQVPSLGDLAALASLYGTTSDRVLLGVDWGGADSGEASA